MVYRTLWLNKNDKKGFLALTNANLIGMQTREIKSPKNRYVYYEICAFYSRY